jgi:Zn-dependent protease
VGDVITMNITLCLFNLLPIPPLDGGAVLARILPRGLDRVVDALNRYGFILLLALLLTGLLYRLMWPAWAVSDFWLQRLFHWAAVR